MCDLFTRETFVSKSILLGAEKFHHVLKDAIFLLPLKKKRKPGNEPGMQPEDSGKPSLSGSAARWFQQQQQHQQH